jgi:hypothetical protein
MVKRRPPWFVSRNPAAIQYAFFISHVGEDAAEVGRLKSAIEAYSGRGGRPPLTCFLDVANWTIGNENSVVIRKYLLKSAHMVAWISPEYLRSLRGWVWMELAYAELIELSLNSDGYELRQPYIVPVFRGVALEQTERTPLLKYWQRQVVVPNKKHSIPQTAKHLVDFHDQEARKRLAEE